MGAAAREGKSKRRCGLNCAPQNVCWSPSPTVTCDSALFGNWIFTGDGAKMQSYWTRVGPPPMTGVLRRRPLKTQGHRHMGRRPRDNRGRDGSDGPTVTERRSGCLPLRKPALERQVLTSRKGVCFQVLATSEDGGLTSHSPSPPLSAGRGFFKEGWGTEQRDQGRGVQSSLRAEELRPF